MYAESKGAEDGAAICNCRNGAAGTKTGKAGKGGKGRAQVHDLHVERGGGGKAGGAGP